MKIMGEKRNFAWPVTTLCKFDYYALKKIMEENHNLFQDKKIIIMGAGIRGTAFSLLLSQMGYQVTAFTDNNPIKVGGSINEYPIWDFKEIMDIKKDCVVLISVENGIALKKQLNEAGFVENSQYFYVENHLYEKFLDEFLRSGPTETLVMGDCGVTDISKKDKNFTNLSELIKEALGEEQTKVLAVHAMGMRAYYHILSAQIKFVTKPQKVVIMANFETFTGKQHILPRSQHAKLFEMLSESVQHRDEELEEYAGVTKERFDNFKVDYFTSSRQAMENMTSGRNDRIVIRMNYMYELREDNENICYMNRIIHMCAENGIRLFFFIPPANYMYAEELFGDKFAEKYGKNVERLKDIVAEQGSEVLDLSYLLTSSQFADIHTIDETTNYEGRVLVKDQLVKKINSMR